MNASDCCVMRWRVGRQGTGYRKLLLAIGRTWDCWLLDYPVGSYIPEHTDPVPGRRHYRANLRLVGEDTFKCSGRVLVGLGPLTVFRPDITPHAVRASKSRRLVLSVGWVA